MPTSQKSQDSQQALGELVEDSSIEPISTETSKSVTTITASGKKGFSIWESYRKAVKKLVKPTSSSSSPSSYREKVSTMVTDYLKEPVIGNPKIKKFMDRISEKIKKNVTLP